MPKWDTDGLKKSRGTARNRRSCLARAEYRDAARWQVEHLWLKKMRCRRHPGLKAFYRISVRTSSSSLSMPVRSSSAAYLT